MKPNVLILFADQQRYDTVNAAGYPHMITPNLDKLASEGCLFSNCHSGNPVCMPARHDLITGFPASEHGYFSNSENSSIKNYAIPTIGRIFSQNDYRTVAVGKMHFHPTREHHGFSQMIDMEEIPRIRQNDDYAMYLKKEGLGEIQNLHGVRPYIYHTPQIAQQDEAHHGTTWVADSAINWLQENGENPFFMMCGFIQPHPPWNTPENLIHLYDDVKIPEPIPVSRPAFYDTTDDNWYGDKDTDLQKEKTRKAYYTAVSMVDYNAGRIIEHLRETGQLDNTLVIYSSDHGEMLQDKGFYSKQLPYDSSVRVPMIVRYPEKFAKNTVRDEFVDLMDILPTCLDICDLEYSYEKELYGKSIVTEQNREYQYSSHGEGHARWIMARNKKYKYIYNFLGGYQELYDMEVDEVNNLLEKEVSAEIENIRLELKAKATEYEEKWGVQGNVINGKLKELDFKLVHPEEKGKHHFWANRQMQPFFEAEVYDRGAVLQKEMQNAVKNKDFSAFELKDAFDNKEWKDSFKENYKNYTGKDDFKLF